MLYLLLYFPFNNGFKSYTRKFAGRKQIFTIKYIRFRFEFFELILFLWYIALHQMKKFIQLSTLYFL